MRIHNIQLILNISFFDLRVSHVFHIYCLYVFIWTCFVSNLKYGHFIYEMCVCVFTSIRVCKYVCMHVCMYVCMYVRTYKHLAAKVGTSKGGGKQWQTTPKNLPKMQCARAIPVT